MCRLSQSSSTPTKEDVLLVWLRRSNVASIESGVFPVLLMCVRSSRVCSNNYPA